LEAPLGLYALFQFLLVFGRVIMIVFYGFFFMSPCTIFTLSGGILIAAPIHFSLLTFYLAATIRIRQRGHNFKTYFIGALENCFGSIFRIVGWALWWMILLPFFNIIALMIIIVIFVFTCQFISNISYLPFHPLINIAIIIIPVMLIDFLVSGRLKKAFFNFLESLGRLKSLPELPELPELLELPEFSLKLAALILGGIIGGIIIVLIIYLMSQLIAPSIWYKIGFKFSQALMIVAVTVMFFIIFKILWRTVKQFRFFGMYKFPPGYFKPEDWKEGIKTASAYAQEELLYRTDHNTLSLKPEQFLEVLKEIRPLIKAEPALSTYWGQRDQLEQVLKQERQG
jgi:hypothetical protein